MRTNITIRAFPIDNFFRGLLGVCFFSRFPTERSRVLRNRRRTIASAEIMIRAILFFLISLPSAPALAGFPSEIVQLLPPKGFEGPTSTDGPGGAHIEAYVHRISGTDRSTLLQLTTYDFGSKLEGIPKKELGNGAEHYLMQFLGGVERARMNFHASKPTQITLGGSPGARVDWTGEARGQSMSGVMYCVIVGTVVVTFHTQSFEDSPPEDRTAALHAIESVTFRTKN